jgi:hypothetical protein
VDDDFRLFAAVKGSIEREIYRLGHSSRFQLAWNVFVLSGGENVF